MNTVSPIKPPAGYWIISLLALLWMLFGVFAWWADLRMDEAALAQFSEAQQQLFRDRPQWIFILYAVAIFSGLLGALGLLLRKRWAVAVFWLSLLAIVVQFGYVLFGMDAIGRLGVAEAVPFPLLIATIGVFLLWFASRAKRRGWLG